MFDDTNTKKILFVGDSITASFETQKLLPEFNIINKGLSGNQSKHLLKRFDRDLLVSNPDMLFVLIGTNDIAQEFTDGEIILNIRNIVEIGSKNIQTQNFFVTSILPTRKNELRPNERIRNLNNKIKILAEELNVKYLNLHPLFADDLGELRADLTDDGLHLNDKAYEIWANFLRQLFKELLD